MTVHVVIYSRDKFIQDSADLISFLGAFDELAEKQIRCATQSVFMRTDDYFITWCKLDLAVNMRTLNIFFDHTAFDWLNQENDAKATREAQLSVQEEWRLWEDRLKMPFLTMAQSSAMNVLETNMLLIQVPIGFGLLDEFFDEVERKSQEAHQ